MPEGPEIRRAADAIAKALIQKPTTGIFFAFVHLKPYEAKLVGKQVVAVKTKGKAIILCFENQLNIYSHNQLYGKWLIRKAHSYPQTNRQLRLAIHNQQRSALLYSASEINVLNDEELSRHPFLSRLGPDVLDDRVTVEQVVERFLDKQFYRRQFMSLLLDQQFLCGLGNYLRSEVLFVAKVHPSLRPVNYQIDRIYRLAEAVLSVTHQSYATRGITNNLQLVAQLIQQGCQRSDYRHYVFNRQGKPCFLCGSEILKEVLGGRRCYYCPSCQSPKGWSGNNQSQETVVKHT